MIDPEIEAFVQRIHQDIPLTHAMGWQIENIDKDQLNASAPLLPNINDKGTFFGGASAALMTISAWSLIKYHLEQLGLTNDVVIHKSQNQWLRPQQDVMQIHCTFDSPVDWSAVQRRLLGQQKTQHLKVVTQGSAGAVVTGTMKANYVILPKK